MIFFGLILFFQGNFIVPLTTARVNIKAPGATVDITVDCITFEPFLNPKVINCLTPEMNVSLQLSF